MTTIFFTLAILGVVAIAIMFIVINKKQEIKRLQDFADSLQNGGMLDVKLNDEHRIVRSKLQNVGMDFMRASSGNELVYIIDYNYQSYVIPNILGISRLSFTFNEIDDTVAWMNIEFVNNITEYNRALSVIFKTLTDKYGKPMINESRLKWTDKVEHVSYSISKLSTRMIIQNEKQ